MHAVGHRLQYGVEHTALALQFGLGLDQRGDIAPDATIAGKVSILIESRIAADRTPGRQRSGASTIDDVAEWLPLGNASTSSLNDSVTGKLLPTPG